MKNRGKVQRKDELAIATQLTKRVRKDELKRFSQYLHAVSLVFSFFLKRHDSSQILSELRGASHLHITKRPNPLAAFLQV